MADLAAEEIGTIDAYQKRNINKLKFRIKFENKEHKTYWSVENCRFVDSILIEGNE